MNKITDLGIILKNYDFCDSIIYDIYWENKCQDLIISLDYYQDTSSERRINLKFIKCFEFEFHMRDSNQNENSDIFSYLTIVFFHILKKDNIIETKFKYSTEEVFMTIRCCNIELYDFEY